MLWIVFLKPNDEFEKSTHDPREIPSSCFHEPFFDKHGRRGVDGYARVRRVLRHFKLWPDLGGAKTHLLDERPALFHPRAHTKAKPHALLQQLCKRLHRPALRSPAV